MAPAEAEQIVEQRLGQDAELVAIGLDAERAVALGELGAVRAVDQRHVGVDRLGPAHRPDDGELAEGVVEMIVAADDVGDAHVVIVDHDRQHVGRRAVRAEQDEIVELAVLHGDPALDLSSITVSPSRGAFRRTTKGASGSGWPGAQSRQGLSIRNGRRSAFAASRCAASSSWLIQQR